MTGSVWCHIGVTFGSWKAPLVSLEPHWSNMGVTWVSVGGPNPIQSVPNPIQPNPNPIQIRSMGGPWPLQVGSGSVHSHSKSDPDGPWPLHVGSGWSHQVGNHRKPSETIRNHPKSSERKPIGLSIVQAKCVVLLYLYIDISIYL